MELNFLMDCCRIVINDKNLNVAKKFVEDLGYIENKTNYPNPKYICLIKSTKTYFVYDLYNFNKLPIDIAKRFMYFDKFIRKQKLKKLL